MMIVLPFVVANGSSIMESYMNRVSQSKVIKIMKTKIDKTKNDLLEACKRGDLEFIMKWNASLQHGIQTSRGDPVNCEELMKTAYENKHMNIVRWLRDNEISVSLSTQLQYSCLLGDLDFVSQFVAEERDKGQMLGGKYTEHTHRINWEGLMVKAYESKHLNIVHYIRKEKVKLKQKQFYMACDNDDVEFVAQCLSDERDDWKEVYLDDGTMEQKGMEMRLWELRLNYAYNKKYKGILSCIRDSGKGSLQVQLYASCLLGDLAFVNSCISENRDKDQDVDWNNLIDISFEIKQLDIVQCIRDGERVDLNERLCVSCKLGDLDYVSSYINTHRDDRDVDWIKVMRAASANKHYGVVRSIMDAKKESPYRQVYGSCLLGDLNCILQYECEIWDWTLLQKIAYESNHLEIVCFIRDNREVSVTTTQLEYSCVTGDLDFVSKWITINRKKEANTDIWISEPNGEELMKTAYDNKHYDIVKYIRDSGVVPWPADKLCYACLIGDMEFLSQYIEKKGVKTRPDEEWKDVTKTAYDSGHHDIVRLIRDHNLGSIQTQLYYSCLIGDLTFISQFIAENRDERKYVDWELLMEAAYENDQKDIVRFIRESDRVVLETQLVSACLNGDNVFVNQNIDGFAENKTADYWEEVIKVAYERGHKETVRLILVNGRGSVQTQLYYACLLGDLKLVAQCITEERDKDQNVDWERVVETALERNQRSIVQYIRDCERVSLYIRLYGGYLLGDLEFVSKCIVEDSKSIDNVPWERLMTRVFVRGDEKLVRHIRGIKQVPLEIQLYGSCLVGDLDFVSSCITENRDKGQTVDWKRLMITAYDNHRPIAKLIVEKGRYGLADLVDNMYNDYRTKFVIQHTGDDVNIEVRPGLTSLHVASYGYIDKPYRDITIMELLLKKKGIEVNKNGFMGRTALHLICHGHNIDIDNIIDNKCKPRKAHNQKSKKSPLHAGGGITGRKVTALIKLMIDGGADTNARDDNGQTPLHLLCLSKGGDYIGELLLEKGANINQQDNEGRTALAVAAQQGNDIFVIFLCRNGCDKDLATLVGQTPLYLTSVANNIQSAEILCEKGAKVNQTDDYNTTPLAAACENDNHVIVNFLLQYKADPSIADKEEQTALHKAAKYGSKRSCQELINSEVDLNVQDITGCTPLHIASIYNRMEIAKALIDAGCSVNIENNQGNIALHLAMANISTKLNSNVDLVRMLVMAGSDINHANSYGQSPVMLSASALNLLMVKFLKENNANILHVDNMQRGLIQNIVTNPLIMFLHKDEDIQNVRNIITWLIQEGIDINSGDLNQQTALHLASSSGNLKMVCILLEIGADVTRRDKFGNMPLMNALEAQDVFQYLWNKTLPHITEKDFCKLQHLSHWLGISGSVANEINRNAPKKLDLSLYPQNVSTLKCKYDSRLEQWLKSEEEELPNFMSDWLPSLQPLTYYNHPFINDVMWEFLKDLQDRVKAVDPLVAYMINRCGSVEEKTKAFAQDECDCSCGLQNIRFDMFEIPKNPGHHIWSAFVHLICKEEYCEDLKRILDGNRRLCQGKLCHYFGKAIAEVLADPTFWAKYPQLQRISPKDISAADRRICTMHVIWSDEICPLLKIDIDLAPVIELPSWSPSWASKHSLMDEIEVIALPKWKMTHEVAMDLMEIGIHSWGPLFDKMPEEMRQGYRLAKVVRGSAVCPQICQSPGTVHVPSSQQSNLPDKTLLVEDKVEKYEEWSNAGEFMNTYFLKQVILHEYTKWYDLNPKRPRRTDLYWAERIYLKMEEAFRNRELYSWFIPTYNLLNDDKFVQFQETAILYARLCRRLLTEESAAHFRKAFLGMKADGSGEDLLVFDDRN